MNATSPGPGVVLDAIHPPQAPLPPHSCDAHVHVFDPARFPYVARRSYTPAAATVDDLLAFQQRIGTERMVLVQPSGYGTDNRCLLDALARLGPARARGVAVVDVAHIPTRDIDALHAGGVRSIRLNLEVQGEHDAGRARALLRQAFVIVARTGWSVQLYADLTLIHEVADTLAQAPTPVVLDHFGGLKAHRGPQQPGFSTLLQLLGTGAVYVKLSAPYRASRQQPAHADLAPLARQLIQAAPERLLWGSDWPHTGSAARRSGDLSRIEPFKAIDDGAMLDLLHTWAPDAVVRQLVLVDNAARLYGFPD